MIALLLTAALATLQGARPEATTTTTASRALTPEPSRTTKAHALGALHGRAGWWTSIVAVAPVALPYPAVADDTAPNLKGRT